MRRMRKRYAGTSIAARGGLMPTTFACPKWGPADLLASRFLAPHSAFARHGAFRGSLSFFLLRMNA